LAYLIRPVAQSDMAGVYSVEKECFDDPYPVQFLDDLAEIQGDRFFVAVENGKVVGYSVGTSDGHIVSVAVDPHHRRRGIGTTLLSAVIRQIMQNRTKEIYLEVRKGNTSAISFYERRGFRISSQIRHYYPDGEDAWVLRRPAESPLPNTS